MSLTCSLSESSSEACSCAEAAGLLPFQLLEAGAGAGAPAWPAHTQPIVYYAEVPELYVKKQKGQEQKNKPKHFQKAFHWYKREQKSCTNKKPAVETFDIGFATWLDHKYQQYLRDRSADAGLKSECSNLQNPVANQDVRLHKSTKQKGLKRILKSPWKKRYVAANRAPDGGNGCIECKESWQTIMRPQSLSRLESENCAQKQSNIESSRITVTSSDTQVVIKSKRKHLLVQETTIRSDDVSYMNKSKKNTPEINELYSKNKSGKKTEKKSKIIKVKCECPQYDPNINVQEKPLIDAMGNNVTSKSNVLYNSTGLVTPIATKNSYAARSKETIVLGKKSTGKIKIKYECPKDESGHDYSGKKNTDISLDQSMNAQKGGLGGMAESRKFHYGMLLGVVRRHTY